MKRDETLAISASLSAIAGLITAYIGNMRLSATLWSLAFLFETVLVHYTRRQR